MDQRIPLVLSTIALIFSLLLPISIYIGTKFYVSKFIPQIDSTISFLEKFSKGGIEMNIPVSTSFNLSKKTSFYINKTIVINGTPYELNEEIPVDVDMVIPIETNVNLKINASQLGMKDQVDAILFLLRKIKDFAS